MAVKRSDFCELINYNYYLYSHTTQACFGRVRPHKLAKSSLFEIAHQTAQTVR
jgi:hypothetical protein